MPENWDEVAAYAQGTCNSEAAIAATFEMGQADEDVITERLADRGLAMCVGCGWWNEDSEMYDGEYCNDCAEEAGLTD